MLEEREAYIEEVESAFRDFCTLVDGRLSKRRGRDGRVVLTCQFPEELNARLEVLCEGGRIDYTIEAWGDRASGIFTSEADYLDYLIERVGLGKYGDSGWFDSAKGRSGMDKYLSGVRKVEIEYFEHEPKRITVRISR